MADAKIRLSVEGATLVKSELDKVNSGLSGMANEAAFLKTTLLGLVGGLSAGAFVAWSKGMIDAADAMNDMSQRTGILVKDLAVYELAAKQSGTSMDSISRGVKGLSGVMATNSEAMRAAGITATDTNGAMLQLANLFAKMPDGMEKTNLAVKIFGKSGMDLIPMLNMGNEGLKEAAEKTAKYAAQMVIMAPMADAFNDNMAEIAMNSKVMGMSMMNNALPALLEITRAMADGSQKGGTFAGILAGLSVGMENYKKGVREFYGMKAPDKGGATGSWEPEKPKVDTSAAFATRLKALQDALNKGGGGGAAAAEKVTEYTRITQEITKTNAVSAQELLYGSKLAASDKYRVEMMAKVEAAYTNHKVSLTEKVKLTAQVTAASAQMYLVEKQAFEVDAIKKNTEAVDKLNEATLKTIESLVAGNEQKRLENEVIGLTAEAVNTLTLKRLDANIAEEKSNLISAISRGDSAAEISLLERKINLLEQQRNLTDIGQNKTAYANVKTTVLGDAKPAASSYDPRELAGIVGAETEKVAAYNATARVVLNNAEAQLAIDRALASSSHELTAAEVERFTSLQAEIDKIRGKLDLNFKIAGLDDMSSKFGGMAEAAGKMGDGFKGATAALSGFSRAFKTLADAEKNTAEGSQQRFNAQIGGYGDMAGAAAEFFDKNSAGYEVLKMAEQGFRAVQLAMSIAAMVQDTTETGASIGNSLARGGADLFAGVMKMFAQSGWGGFVGAAALIALAASLGGGGSGGAGGGGGGTATDGAGGANDYSGAGGINKHGQYNQTRFVSPAESAGQQTDSTAAEDANNAAKALNELNLSMRVLKNGATALEQDLIDVRKAAQGAGRAQHDMATNGMGEAELKAYNYNAALENQIAVLMDVANGTNNASKNAKKLADETTSLSIELMKASGDIAGARAMQRDLDTVGYTSGEIAVYDYNAALQEQIDAMSAGAGAADTAAQAENDLAQKRYELANVINVLLGNSTQLEMDRKTELAGVTDTSVIALINLRNALEDIDSNIVNLIANADKAFAVLERSVKAERDALTKTYKAGTDARAAQSGALKDLTALASALKTSLSSFDIGPDRATAQAQIAMYVAIAKAGGGLPELKDIDPALKAVAKPSEQLFKTFVDYQRDQMRTANDIADLAEMAGGQVSIEQATLDTLKATYDAEMGRLDDVLKAGQAQLDKLHDIDTSVISVAAAIIGLASAFNAADAAQAGAASARSAASAGVNLTYAAPAPSSAGGGGGGGGYSGGGAAGLENIAGQTNKDIVAAYRAYYNRNPDEGGYETYSHIGYGGDRLMQAILGGSAGNPESSDFQMARSRGYDPLNPTAKFLASILSPAGGGASGQQSVESYAVGSNYIPYDQIAQIHQGERILPAADNRQLMARLSDPQSNNDALVGEIRALRAEVAGLRIEAQQTAVNTGKTARQLDRLSPDGDALAVRTAA